MTPKAQRIAIAEACGWAVHDADIFFGRHQDGAHSATIPNYLNDLNAMHEAEKVLDFETTTFRTGSFNLYRDTLMRMCGIDNWGRATAGQRAEAFLRTIGKWKD